MFQPLTQCPWAFERPSFGTYDDYRNGEKRRHPSNVLRGFEASDETL
jgi:hypothetical protein